MEHFRSGDDESPLNRSVPQYLTREHWTVVDLTRFEQLPQYQGNPNSTEVDDDIPKVDYLEELGICVPEDCDRANLLALFRVSCCLVVLETIKRIAPRSQLPFAAINNILHKECVDTFGYRVPVESYRECSEDPLLLDDIFQSLNCPGNRDGRVGTDELQRVVQYAVRQLSGDIDTVG